MASLANVIIEVRVRNKWERYAVTWEEYVKGEIEEAKERGYSDVRIRRI